MATKAQREYLDKVYNDAIAIGIPDVQARLAASQSAIETGYGKHAPGNAYFGMKAGSSWDGPVQSLRTREEENGALKTITDNFRVYDSAQASLADWWERLQVRWPAAAQATDFDTAVAGLKAGQKGGYATDSQYPSKLNYANARLAPRPPANIPEVATELSVDPRAALAGGAAQVPLPRPRPVTAPVPRQRPRDPVADAMMAMTPKLGWENDTPNPATSVIPRVMPTSSFEAARQTASQPRTVTDPVIAALLQPKAQRPAQQPSPAQRNAIAAVPPRATPAPTMAQTRSEQDLVRAALMAKPVNVAPKVAAAAAPIVKTVANPAYEAWAKQYGTVTAPTMQETRSEQAMMRGTPKPAAVIPPAPPKTITITQKPLPAPAPLVPQPAAAPAGGFNLGGLLQQGTDFLGQKANDVGTALQAGAGQVQTGLGNAGQAAVDVLTSEAMKSLKVRTALINGAMAQAVARQSAHVAATDPRKGQVISTANNGNQVVGQRLNNSTKGRTVTGSDWFNSVTGI